MKCNILLEEVCVELIDFLNTAHVDYTVFSITDDMISINVPTNVDTHLYISMVSMTHGIIDFSISIFQCAPTDSVILSADDVERKASSQDVINIIRILQKYKCVK